VSRDRSAPRHDPDLARFRDALAPFGVRVGARRIRPGDEAAFAAPGRPRTFANLARRRASGAARIVARSLLGEIGGDVHAPLWRCSSGAPAWPGGFLGSLAHDDEFALAAVARAGAIAAVGVDIEPAEPLPDDILAVVASARERRSIDDDRVMARLIFAAKEAVYKAIHPLDGSTLEYDDIEIRLAEGRAVLRDGRSPRLILDVGPSLLVAALMDS
jgi:4'-phosphopantetheinyl transferase EntD